MQKIAVNILAPDYAYPVFKEIGLLYYAHLKNLSYDVTFIQNRLDKERLNLVIGYHYLPPKAITMLAGNFRYILVQLEQLSHQGGWFSQEKENLNELIPIFQGAEQVWDYDQSNLEFLKGYGLEAKLLPLGYHQSLERFRPDFQPSQDVIFYGALGSTLHPFPRRVELLKKLREYCQVSILKNKYGSELDNILKTAKLVINIHGSDNLPIKEQARIFYLLTNQVLVVSEESVWNPYGEDLLCYSYDHLIEGVLEWLNKSSEERQVMARRGHERLKQIPFQEKLSQYLSE